MANITAITPLRTWQIREIPGASDLNSDVSPKINTYIANQVLVNSGLNMLLQGTSGGLEQAAIPLVMVSAPTGWTRGSGFLDDHILRISDGTTVPPGSNPTALFGSHGGSWTISGLSSSVQSDHVHDLASHTHGMNGHTHTVGSHTHGMTHTHTDPGHNHAVSNNTTEPGAASGGTVVTGSVGGFAIGLSLSSHTHTLTHNHGGLTTTTSSGVSGTSSVTDTLPITDVTTSASTDQTGGPSTTSGAGGSHSHNVFHDGSWRPAYINVLICTKD